jgi:hypothetical protein
MSRGSIWAARMLRHVVPFVMNVVLFKKWSYPVVPGMRLFVAAFIRSINYLVLQNTMVDQKVIHVLC